LKLHRVHIAADAIGGGPGLSRTLCLLSPPISAADDRPANVDLHKTTGRRSAPMKLHFVVVGAAADGS